MSVVPIFPLPETVFFPETLLHLHLFEPRYRQMGADVIGGDGLLVVVLLSPGWEKDYAGTPAVHDIATLGRVEHSEKLPDGRINIVLRGLERVRLLPARGAAELAPGKLYRARPFESAPEEREPREVEAAASVNEPVLRARWMELLEKNGKSGETILAIPEGASFDGVLNHIASFVEAPASRKQALLEEDVLSSRVTSLLTMLGDQLEFWRTLTGFRQMRPEDPSVN